MKKKKKSNVLVKFGKKDPFFSSKINFEDGHLIVRSMETRNRAEQEQCKYVNSLDFYEKPGLLTSENNERFRLSCTIHCVRDILCT